MVKVFGCQENSKAIVTYDDRVKESERVWADMLSATTVNYTGKNTMAVKTTG